MLEGDAVQIGRWYHEDVQVDARCFFAPKPPLDVVGLAQLNVVDFIFFPGRDLEPIAIANYYHLS